MDQEPSPATNNSFAHWLGAELRIRRLTQRGLAQRAGVDHSTITRLLQGQRVPSLATATRIADALGHGTPPEIFADAGEPIPVARVRAALQADPVLGEVDVSAVMRSRASASDTWQFWVHVEPWAGQPGPPALARDARSATQLAPWRPAPSISSSWDHPCSALPSTKPEPRPSCSFETGLRTWRHCVSFSITRQPLGAAGRRPSALPDPREVGDWPRRPHRRRSSGGTSGSTSSRTNR